MSIGNTASSNYFVTASHSVLTAKHCKDLIVIVVTAVVLCLASVSPGAAQVSPGCTAANDPTFGFDFDNSGGGGTLNIAQLTSFGNALFNVGDVVTVTVTVTGGGTVTITGQPPQVFNQIFAASGTGNLTVINITGGTTSTVVFTLNGNVNAGGRIRVAFNCTPAAAAGGGTGLIDGEILGNIADAVFGLFEDAENNVFEAIDGGFLSVAQTPPVFDNGGVNNDGPGLFNQIGRGREKNIQDLFDKDPEINELANRIAALIPRIVQLQDDQEEEEVEEEQHRAKIAKLKGELDAEREERRRLEEIRAQQEQQQANLQADLDRIKGEVERASSELERARELARRIEFRIEQLENQGLLEEIPLPTPRFLREIEEYTDLHIRFREIGSIADRETALRELQQQVAPNAAQIEALDEQIEEVSAQIGKQIDKIIFLESDEGKRRTEEQIQEQERQILINQLDAKELDGKIQNLEQERQSLEARIKAREAEIRAQFNRARTSSLEKTTPRVADSGPTDGNSRIRTADAISLQPDGAKGAKFHVDVDQLASATVAPAGAPGSDIMDFKGFDVWVSGGFSVFDDNQTADRNGAIGSLAAGIAYPVTEVITIGGQLTFKSGDVESKALASDLDSDFLGFGVFARTDLYQGLLFDAAFNYEHGWNDIKIAGIKGDFDSDSISLGGRLSKRFPVSPAWWVEPNIGITYSTFDRESYTDAAGTFVPGSTVDQGRIQFGPKVGYVFVPDHDSIVRGQATFAVNGLIDYLSNGDAAVGNGIVAKDPTNGVQLSTGLNLNFNNGMTGSASFSYTGIDKLDSYSGNVTLAIPLN